ncbi:MAG TPA: DUF1003 domain-containing protein [Solirubrobacteraceae bacterium]|nr:DUF1003 domain-containing protein [Solirubrobacteraceae bacterium]
MARKDDLSTPRGTPGGPSYDPDAFAQFAEKMARFLGTGRYLAAQTIFVAVWIILNGLAFTNAWDPYPFILLNLAFSTQAAYAAPLILLAQNRQTDRDRAEAERDREINSRSLADTEYLAREIAGIRLALESKPDRDDVTEAIERLTRTIEDTYGSAAASYAGGSVADTELGEDEIE